MAKAVIPNVPEIPDPTDAPGFGHWLAGFVDGEGHFGVEKVHSRDHYSCKFSLKLRRDDVGILYSIQDYLKAGRVYLEMGWGNSKPQARILINSKADCLKVLKTFRKFPLRAKKRRDFELWATAVETWISRERGGRWTGASDWSDMELLRQELSAVKKYNRKLAAE